MTITIPEWNIYAGLAINGIFTGLGCAIGTWSAQQHIIKRIEKITQDLTKEKNKKKEFFFRHSS